MNTELLPTTRLSREARTALMDAAKHRAVELRREAIDLFAAGLARWLASARRAGRHGLSRRQQPEGAARAQNVPG